MTQAEAQHGGHAYTNHLIHESSPYLLMHAHNPVDWHAWNQEAFDLARRENKPIFLSVGYSTCHWCHVMEHESFSDPSIAEVMNRDFVNIKVDREERPDVDRVYMTFVQATTGGGGWPMSVFLTPRLEPFFGGTYWPPTDRYGRPGFSTVLARVAEAWQNDPGKIEKSAADVTDYLRKSVEAPAASGAAIEASTLDHAYERIKAGYDADNGGFGNAPKFPRPVIFNFLLRYHARTANRAALEMTRHTLSAMSRGGIHDHLGGGFHRYSVDERWHVPHFEKMLYDQAQLASAYLTAYQITREPLQADTARDILDYVLRDMRSPEGGFYSAEDADSLIEAGQPEHGEGAFYVWTAGEIEQALGTDAAAVFNYVYDVRPSGNVAPQHDPQGEFQSRNILQRVHSAQEAAQHFGQPEAEIQAVLAASRAKLLEARAARPRPARDDKILTGWNGLMVSAFARAAQVLGDESYLEAAKSAADFIRAKLYEEQDANLKRRYRAGRVAIDAFLDDYTFWIQGLLDLYEASFEVSYLEWAGKLQDQQDRRLWGGENAGYFSAPGEDASILVRMRDAYDGAEPSGNSVAAMNLLRLGQMTDCSAWRGRAQELFGAFGRHLEGAPETVPQMLAAVDFSMAPPRQIVIAGERADQDTQALLRVVHERYLPNKTLLLAGGPEQRRQLAELVPFIRDLQPLDGKATAYICENYVCKLPTSDPQQVRRLLSEES